MRGGKEGNGYLLLGEGPERVGRRTPSLSLIIERPFFEYLLQLTSLHKW